MMRRIFDWVWKGVWNDLTVMEKRCFLWCYSDIHRAEMG